MATGWAQDGAVQQQIDDSVKDAMERARAQLPSGPSLSHCEECGEEIDIKRLQVNPLARFCIACKTQKEEIEKIQKEETRFKE